MINKKILVLSWHPEASNIMNAGGFRRAYEIVKRVPSDISVVCLDSMPSYFYGLDNKNIVVNTYNIPFLIRFITKLHFISGKVMEKIYVSLLLFFKIIFYYRDYIIYVPYSELNQLSLPAVFSRIVTRNRVVLANLNVNHFFPETILSPVIHKMSSLNITISKDLQDELLKSGVIASSINQVGIDLDYVKAISDQEKKYDGIFIGRHTTEKGILDVLEVCKILNLDKNFTLVTVGNIQENKKRDIENKIIEMGLEGKVILKGTVSEEEKYQLLKQSRICLFTSHQEGWGIVPQEAIVCNVPVVAYNLKVYQENIAGCKAVSLVAVGDHFQFAKEVIKVVSLTDQEKMDLLKQSNEFIKRFSWDNIAKNEYKLILGEVNAN
jgi:glycosyltransferase involved in cell wall biosynthesis